MNRVLVIQPTTVLPVSRRIWRFAAIASVAAVAAMALTSAARSTLTATAPIGQAPVAAVGAAANLAAMPLADTLQVAIVRLADEGYRCDAPETATAGPLQGLRVAECSGTHGSNVTLAAAGDGARIAWAQFTVWASSVESPGDLHDTVMVVNRVARPMVVLAQGSRDREALANYVVSHALERQMHLAHLFGGITLRLEPPPDPAGRWVVTASAMAAGEGGPS